MKGASALVSQKEEISESKKLLTEVRDVLSSVGLSSEVGLETKQQEHEESQLRIDHPASLA